METIGTGVLTGERSERVRDRYGCVCLAKTAIPLTAAMNGVEEERVPLTELDLGEGELVAEVLETRDSEHIGDLFHGVRPTTPNVGDVIVLGRGRLFYEGDFQVGLIPRDGRRTQWLDMRALYRAHSQTVRLAFRQ